MPAGSNLNSIECTIFNALIDNKIRYENFTKIINEEKDYCELKESIRMMKIQRSDIERNKLIEDVKEYALIKLLDKMKELINLKYQV